MQATIETDPFYIAPDHLQQIQQQPPQTNDTPMAESITTSPPELLISTPPQPTTPSSTSSKRKQIPQSPETINAGTMPSKHQRSNKNQPKATSSSSTSQTATDIPSTSQSPRFVLKSTLQPTPAYVPLDSNLPPLTKQQLQQTINNYSSTSVSTCIPIFLKHPSATEVFTTIPVCHPTIKILVQIIPTIH